MSKHVSKLPLLLFVFSLLLTAHVWGLLAGTAKVFPHDQFLAALAVGWELAGQGPNGWMYLDDNRGDLEIDRTGGAPFEGLNLITRLGENETLVTEIRDLDGDLVQQWEIDWFEF